jgi:hypothetical protein
MSGDATKDASTPSEEATELFKDIGSLDFLGFEFNNRKYEQQLQEAIKRTGEFCAVKVELKKVAVRGFWEHSTNISLVDSLKASTHFYSNYGAVFAAKAAATSSI